MPVDSTRLTTIPIPGRRTGRHYTTLDKPLLTIVMTCETSWENLLMHAICQFCGAPKANPVYSCPQCYRIPQSDLECGEAILLSRACMSDNDLASCAVQLKQGIPIGLPPAIIASVAADYRKALTDGAIKRKANEHAQKLKKAKEDALIRRVILTFVAIFVPAFCFWLAYEAPSVRLWYAKKQDTPEAYSKVMAEFAGTIHAIEAKRRYLELTDDSAWASASQTNTLQSLRSYLTGYPDGKHHAPAKDALFSLALPLWEETASEKVPENIAAFPEGFEEVAERFPVVPVLDKLWNEITTEKSLQKVASFRRLPPPIQSHWPIIATMRELASPEWEQVKKARSLERIAEFDRNYPQLRQWYKAEEARELLYNDPSWVKEQDQLAHYQRFVASHPKHKDTPSMQKRIIDLEVAAIAAGDHGALPKAEATGQSRGARTIIALKNDTGYELTVRFSGTESTKVVLAQRTAQSVDLPNGTFKVAASVDASHVANYYGTDVYKGGVYDLSFYISSSPLNLPGDYLPSPLEN